MSSDRARQPPTLRGAPGARIEQVRRYHYPVGLIMLDIDNFKSVNDTHGHPQYVARVVRDSSREV